MVRSNSKRDDFSRQIECTMKRSFSFLFLLLFSFYLFIYSLSLDDLDNFSLQESLRKVFLQTDCFSKVIHVFRSSDANWETTDLVSDWQNPFHLSWLRKCSLAYGELNSSNRSGAIASGLKAVYSTMRSKSLIRVNIETFDTIAGVDPATMFRPVNHVFFK